MTPSNKKEKEQDWLYRILVTMNLLIILWGYIDWVITRNQISTPLIPKSTVAQIIMDRKDVAFEAAIPVGVFMLGAIWLYSFSKKSLAIWLLALTPLSYFFYVSLF